MRRAGVRGCPLMTRFFNCEFFFFGSFFLFASQQKEKMNVTKIVRTLTLIDPESSSG